jgi:hypothetical protein
MERGMAAIYRFRPAGIDPENGWGKLNCDVIRVPIYGMKGVFIAYMEVLWAS